MKGIGVLGLLVGFAVLMHLPAADPHRWLVGASAVVLWVVFG